MRNLDQLQFPAESKAPTKGGILLLIALPLLPKRMLSVVKYAFLDVGPAAVGLLFGLLVYVGIAALLWEIVAWLS